MSAFDDMPRWVASFQGHGFRWDRASDLWRCIRCGNTTTKFSESLVPRCKRPA